MLALLCSFAFVLLSLNCSNAKLVRSNSLELDPGSAPLISVVIKSKSAQATDDFVDYVKEAAVFSAYFSFGSNRVFKELMLESLQLSEDFNYGGKCSLIAGGADFETSNIRKLPLIAIELQAIGEANDLHNVVIICNANHLDNLFDPDQDYLYLEGDSDYK